MDKYTKNKGAISKPRRNSRPDAPIYVPPAGRRSQQTSLSAIAISKTHKKDIGQNAENMKELIQASETTILQMGKTSDKIKLDISTNPVDGQSEHSFAKSSSVPNIHFDCKTEPDVPELFVINKTKASLCTDKSDTKSNEEIICKKDVDCTKDNLQEINIASTIKNTEGNSCASVQEDTSKQRNINSEIDSKNTEMVSWIEKNKDHDQEELLRASEVINRRNKRIMKQSFNTSDVLIISDSNNRNNNGHEHDLKSRRVPVSLVPDTEPPVDCWEDLLNENDAAHKGLMLKISQSVGNVNLNPVVDNVPSKEILEGELSHILEIYDFPKEFQTRDLVSILDSFRCTNYHIKWVDENHALAVFTSGFAAGEFVKVKHPLIKLRSFAEASEQSLSKAKRYPNAMMPFTSRPQTCPQTARRLVTGALGLKLENAREERAKEIKILKEAREKRRLNLKLQDAAWEGKLPSK